AVRWRKSGDETADTGVTAAVQLLEQRSTPRCELQDALARVARIDGAPRVAARHDGGQAAAQRRGVQRAEPAPIGTRARRARRQLVQQARVREGEPCAEVALVEQTDALREESVEPA